MEFSADGESRHMNAVPGRLMSAIALKNIHPSLGFENS